MKSVLSELAVFGGPVAFERPLHVGAPNIGNRQRLFKRLKDMLDSRWLTNDGPFVQQFEQALRQQIGVKHCIATCNATVALEMLVRAAGLSGEVIVPAFTFVATAHALRWVGLTPVFADIDPDTHTIDPAAIDALVTSRTSAIIGVHLWGRACDVDALEAVAARRRLTLLFDAAQAVGSSYRGRPIGQRGRAEVLSFHATKVMNSFEGGAIVTNDDGVAARARHMRVFGFSDYDTVVGLGTNGKMTEAAAAMGLTSFESLDAFIEANKTRHELYERELRGMTGVTLLKYDTRHRANYHYVVIQIDPISAGITRDEIQKLLFAENVLARRYFYPGCHRMEPYASDRSAINWSLPATDRVASQVLCLPTGTAVSPTAIRQVCSIIRLILSAPIRVRQQLRHASLSATQSRKKRSNASTSIR